MVWMPGTPAAVPPQEGERQVGMGAAASPIPPAFNCAQWEAPPEACTPRSDFSWAKLPVHQGCACRSHLRRILHLPCKGPCCGVLRSLRGSGATKTYCVRLAVYQVATTFPWIKLTMSVGANSLSSSLITRMDMPLAFQKYTLYRYIKKTV